MIVRFEKEEPGTYRFDAHGVRGRCWKAADIGRGWYAQTDLAVERGIEPDYGRTRYQAVATATGNY